MKIITDGNPEGFYDQLQYETVLAERAQREAIREAQIEWLERAQTYSEFCEARDEMQKRTAEEPDKPLDEVSMHDFNLRRDAREGK
jgi:hypothetical protein